MANVYRNYTTILQNLGLEYQEDDVWLYYGNVGLHDTNWVIHLSVVAREGEDLFKTVVPLLAGMSVPFQAVKNEIVHYRINFGVFGPQIVGKIFTIFPKNEAAAIEIIDLLRVQTQAFHGRGIFDAVKLGSVLYATFYNQEKELFLVPEKIPFRAPKKYRAYTKARRRVGGFYFLKEELSFVPKGVIFKGINTKWFAFNFCVIKQGLAYALDDPEGRSVKERLKWEKHMLEVLGPHIRVPKVIEYFEEHDDHFLVIEYIEGRTFEKLVLDLKNGEKLWKNISTHVKLNLLEYFDKVLSSIATVHRLGFVHRDINPGNIIIEGNEVCLLDLELAYDMNASNPDPPFILGTFGYASPEQLKYATPTVYQDIFALGAVLIFMLTGEEPVTIIGREDNEVLEILNSSCDDSSLTSLVFNSIKENAIERPSLETVKNLINQLKHPTLINIIPA